MKHQSLYPWVIVTSAVIHFLQYFSILKIKHDLLFATSNLVDSLIDSERNYMPE